MKAVKQACKIRTTADKYYSDWIFCRCKLCECVSLHNMKWEVKMVTDSTGEGKNIPDSTVQTRAMGRLNAIKLFFKAFLKYIGLFLLGIFVGMGIVLKNPPSSKELQDKIKKLEEKQQDVSVLTVKDSVSFD